MRFIVYNLTTGNQIYTETKAVIVPARDKNLVAFSWYVPQGLNSEYVKVYAEIIDGTKVYNPNTRYRRTTPFV